MGKEAAPSHSNSQKNIQKKPAGPPLQNINNTVIQMETVNNNNSSNKGLPLLNEHK